MVEFTSENQGTMTYLVYEIQPEDAVDSMGLGMITNNRIQGLAEAFTMQMDTHRYIKYNVSAKIPVSQFFDGQVNRKRLLGVFNGIVNAVLSAQDYMINPSSILLDLKHIYTDVSTCETILICLPIEGRVDAVDLGTFFKNIMFSTQFDQTENCDHVARIINYLNSSPSFSLLDFKSVLDNLGGMGQPYYQPVQPQRPPVQPPQYQPVQPAPQPVRPAPQPVQPAPQPVRPAPQPVQPAPQQVQPQPRINRAQMIAQQQAQGQTPQSQIHPSKRLTSQDAAIQGQRGMQIPGQGPAAQPVQAKPLPPAPQLKPGEKPMTFMNLMMHYSKENLEKYKEQKEYKKSVQAASAAPAAPGPAPAPVKKGKPAPAANPNINIPGQAAGGAGFAIPGQGPAAQPVQPVQPPQPVQPVQPQRPATQMPQQRAYAQPVQQNPVQPQQPANTGYAYTGAQISQTTTTTTIPMSGKKVSFGETTTLGEATKAGLTSVLDEMPTGGNNVIRPHLFRIKTQEQIYITADSFKIGKEKSYVNYFIPDNPNVSRSHAVIIRRNGQYFIVDTNSTNHTYVNGGMIQSNAEVPISHGTRIRFANEEFEFRMN